MDEVKNLLVSPAFWFASVVLAFLLSFFANYAKDWTDKWFLRRSHKKDEQAKRRQKDFEAKVARLRTNPSLLALYQSNIVYQKLRQVLYFLVSYLCIALSLHNALNGNFVGALGMVVFGVLIAATQGRLVSKQLHNLRAVLNAALEGDESHFVE